MVFSSSQYWEDRYKAKGNSGSGSYGRLERFKVEFINSFIDENEIKTVLDIGCGDGNQIKDLVDLKYTGVDVSETIVENCKMMYQDDSSKLFYVYSENLWRSEKYDLCLSLDVIFHLVEDEVFDRYMQDLFDNSKRFVIIYASNYERKMSIDHVYHRKYVQWCEENLDGWSLKDITLNPFPFESDESSESVSDFYVFEKCSAPGFTYQDPLYILRTKQKEVDLLRGILHRKDTRYDTMIAQKNKALESAYSKINESNEVHNKKIQDAYDIINSKNAEIKKLKSAPHEK